MINKETKKDKTINNGIRSEIYYLDKNGNSTDKSKAVKLIIKELDSYNNVIFETFGTIKK